MGYSNLMRCRQIEGGGGKFNYKMWEMPRQCEQLQILGGVIGSKKRR